MTLATTDHEETALVYPPVTASDQIAEATEWANALHDIVEKKKLFVEIKWPEVSNIPGVGNSSNLRPSQSRYRLVQRR